MRYSNFNRRSACLGFSLIELLLALAISVTALLGFAQLQQKNLSSERELIRSVQARLLLNEISATLEASRHPDYYLTSGNSDISVSDCLLKMCNSQEFARFQLALWVCRAAGVSSRCRKLSIAKPLFPQGKLSIARSGQQFLIQLKWQALSGKEKTITQKILPIHNIVNPNI